LFLKKLSGIIRSRCVNAKTTDASKTGAKNGKIRGILRWLFGNCASQNRIERR